MYRYLVILLLLAAAAWSAAADQEPSMDAMDQINYSVGHQIGTDFMNQQVEMRLEMLIQGIQDAVQSNKPRMTKGEMRKVLLDMKKMVLAGEQATKERYRGEGRAFLDANARKEGVVTLPSGLQYQVLKSGDGPSPTIEDTVVVNYVGTRIDGTEFDSSERHGKPAQFQVKKLIQGWIEALPLMHTGDRWKLFVPADLAYGERGPLADQTLIFDIELIEVADGGKAPATQQEVN